MGGTPAALRGRVDWPIQPVEIQRRFVPRFCPRRKCLAHRRTRGSRRFRFQYFGTFTRADGRVVPRYRCLTCRRTFSKQTFAVSYYLKRPELLVPVAAGLQAGSAHRQIARSQHCAASTVTRLSARLGRHSLLFHVLALSHLPRFDEPIVLDHFESFVRTQDYAVGIATPIGHRSWFVYGLDPCPHAGSRKGTPVRPKPPRQESRGGYRGSAARILDVLARFLPDSSSIRLITDGHDAYRSALRERRFNQRFAHRAYPNPKRGPKGSRRSWQARERDAAMFPNDQLHSFVRHSAAHHRRETIAFGRRLNALLERMFVTIAWKNFIKGVSERKPDPTTPAMRVGLTTEPWSWPRILARRLFPERLPVPKCWLELYRRKWVTPGGPNSRHELARAY